MAGTGEGQLVEVNLLSTALSGMVNQSSAWVAGGNVPNRMGNAHLGLFPYEPLPTSDGDLIITAGNDGQFRRLCDALGIPEVADDPRFAHNQDRNTHREVLRPLLVRPSRGGPAPIGSGPHRCRRRVRPDQHGRGGVRFATEIGLDPVVTVGEGDRAMPSVRNPISFSATPARYVLPPPGLGEHDAEIRAWLTDQPASATVTRGAP